MLCCGPLPRFPRRLGSDKFLREGVTDMLCRCRFWQPQGFAHIHRSPIFFRWVTLRQPGLGLEPFNVCRYLLRFILNDVGDLFQLPMIKPKSELLLISV